MAGKSWKPSHDQAPMPSLKTSEQRYCMHGERGAHGQGDPEPRDKNAQVRRHPKKIAQKNTRLCLSRLFQALGRGRVREKTRED